MKRIGVIGGGQLAWMMAGAAKRLGVQLVVQTPSPQDPAVAIAAEAIFAPVDDAAATAELASRCDVITFENEFVNLQALSPLAEQGVCFRPSLEVLVPILDKYHQRCYLRDLGLPVPKFVAIEEQERLTQFGFPAVLKARRQGYDGQGTFIIKDIDALKHKLEASSRQQLKRQSLFLLEEFIPFERELAVIAARSTSGEIAIYPVVETQQKEQVCRRVLVPADISLSVVADIEAKVSTLLNSLQAVGVFGIELFLTSSGSVLVNEISPRTHNSGHFTLDACETSQFEQHLRAVCGLPLGGTGMSYSAAVMVNLLGVSSPNRDLDRTADTLNQFPEASPDYWAKLQQLEQIPQANVYWYGKTESRPGRKLGHVTVLLNEHNREQGSAITQTIESIWYDH